ncbi:hypothetical protein UAS_00904 [Enterococcus asini ATCC 700915]|uniref:VWFA domain-containing protein n=1 Tax=Enterococcus asini ATCC 700915 TaxID=1158606 RepID=R2PY82_9ENTE|nr:SpaA isopeptide-forming pilin-related protein [Enterococcus asini]EOH88143.1 hypothetical protein UAS_00904 [Enterococcus asini ATCC 700915]EOT55940.1 hypothetical protein I579_02304 [Enterococcus asini ATCC 700915]
MEKRRILRLLLCLIWLLLYCQLASLSKLEAETILETAESTESTESTEALQSTASAFSPRVTSSEAPCVSSEADSTTESAVTSTEASDESQIIQGPVRNSGEFRNFSAKGIDLVEEPFSYGEHSEPAGWYPLHHTQQFLAGGDLLQDWVQNYQYAVPESSGTVPRFELADGTLPDFDRGYHEFGTNITEAGGRLNTKKSLRLLPGDESEKKFEVILDTLGDVVVSKSQVDLVLVIERSTRMIGTTGTDNWTVLKASLESFLTDLFAQGLDLRVGLVGFSQTEAELAMMKYRFMGPEEKKHPENYRYEDFFSNNPETILNRDVFSKIKDTAVGAPTFLGIDGGLFLLGLPQAGREEATKILCTITAGAPTYFPTSSYYQNPQNENTLLSVQESLALCDFDGTPSTLKFFRAKEEHFSGDGLQASGEDQENARAFYTARQSQSAHVSWQAIQFSVGLEENTLPALGSQGFFQGANQEALTQALQQVLPIYQETIHQATLVEQFSPYVTFEQDSVETAALEVTEDGKLRVTPTNSKVMPLEISGKGTLSWSQLTLGRDTGVRQGVRLRYVVSVKGAYRDNHFYPVSQETYLENGTESRAYYAQPSIRDGPKEPEPVIPVNVRIISQVKDSQEKIKGMQYGLYRTEAGGEAVYTSTLATEEGWSDFSEVLPGDYWLREVQVPKAFLTSGALRVTISETGEIIGLPNTNLIIEKERKPIHLQFQQHVAGLPLSEGSFALQQASQQIPLVRDDSGNFQASLVLPGTYQLVELAPPLGYRPIAAEDLGELTIAPLGEITFSSGEVTVTEEATKRLVTLPTLQRQLKPYTLTIKQRNTENDALLTEAGFELYDSSPLDDPTVEPIAVEVEQADGSILFKEKEQSVLLQPGITYYLKETTHPEDYLPMQAVLSFQINETGQAVFDTLGEQSPAETTSHFTLETDDLANHLKIELVRSPVGKLPKTGGAGKSTPWGAWSVLLIGLIGGLLLERWYQRVNQEV